MTERQLTEMTERQLTEQELILRNHFERYEQYVVSAKLPGWEDVPEGYTYRELPKGTDKHYALATLLTDRLSVEENIEVGHHLQDIADYMQNGRDVRPSIIYLDGYIYLTSVVATGGGSNTLRTIVYARERAFTLEFLERVERISNPSREYGRRDTEEDYESFVEGVGRQGYKNDANKLRRLDYPGRILWSRERETGEVETLDRDDAPELSQDEFMGMDPVDQIYYVKQLFGKEFYRKEVQLAVELSFYNWGEVILFEAIRNARMKIASFLSDIAAIQFVFDEDNEEPYHFDVTTVIFGPGGRPDTYYYAIVERWRNDVYPEIEAVWHRFKEFYQQSQRANVELTAEMLEMPVRFFMAVPYMVETIMSTLEGLDQEYLQNVTGDFTEAMLYVQERVLVNRGDQIGEDVLHELQRKID